MGVFPKKIHHDVEQIDPNDPVRIAEREQEDRIIQLLGEGHFFRDVELRMLAEYGLDKKTVRIRSQRIMERMSPSEWNLREHRKYHRTLAREMAKTLYRLALEQKKLKEAMEAFQHFLRLEGIGNTNRVPGFGVHSKAYQLKPNHKPKGSHAKGKVVKTKPVEKLTDDELFEQMRDKGVPVPVGAKVEQFKDTTDGVVVIPADVAERMIEEANAK
jgi:hypothetical protein